MDLPPRETSVTAPEVVALERTWINLADARLGASIVAVTDEYYGSGQRILVHRPASKYPFNDEGYRWVDGWETSRRRVEGHEHLTVALGRPGAVRAIVIDTSYFTGNFPRGAVVEGCSSDGVPGDAADWRQILPYTALEGHRQHVFHVPETAEFTHVRLHIYPDGGLARLRVFGSVSARYVSELAEPVDLACIANGARALGANDIHFGSPSSMLTPGRSFDFGKGWETRRRREPGNDWAVIKLAAPGIITSLEADTHYFVRNCPEYISLASAYAPELPDETAVNQAMFWKTVLPRQKLKGGAQNTFQLPSNTGPATHIRVDIYPDGGITRLRLLGRLIRQTS